MNATLEIPVTAPVTKLPPEKPVKGNILVADADPAIRQVLLQLLMEEGYAVQTAANGTEALVLAQATEFDLALLDLNTPDADGWEACEQLAAEHPLLPIIVIATRTNQFFAALASGVAALLEKPLDFTKLFAMIHSLLEGPVEMRLSPGAGRPRGWQGIMPGHNGAKGKAN